MTVRYEDLVQKFEPTMRRVIEFLDWAGIRKYSTIAKTHSIVRSQPRATNKSFNHFTQIPSGAGTTIANTWNLCSGPWIDWVSDFGYAADHDGPLIIMNFLTALHAASLDHGRLARFSSWKHYP